MKTVFSIDPGVTTGVSVWEITNRGALLVGQFEGPREIPIEESLKAHPETPSESLVIIEKVTLGPHSPQIQVAIEVVGVARFLFRGCHIIEQPPGLREGARRRVALPGVPSRHVRDAIWHAISYFERQRIPWMFM